MKTWLAAVLATVIFAPQSSLAAPLWDIDTKHSSATFSVKHMMVSNVRGQMGGITGTSEYDGRNVDSVKIKAELDPSTINTSDAGRDEHLRGADFFDVAKYPKITFESTGIIPLLGGGFKLGGKLTMHGVTKTVELSVDGPTDVIKDKKGNEKIGAAATTVVNRKDFGMSYNSVLDSGGVAIGEDVKITIDLELVKQKGDDKK